MISAIIEPVYFVYRKTDNNWSIKDRIMQDHEIVYVHKGKGYTTSNNKEYRIKSGDFIYLAPKEKNSWSTDKTDPLVFWALHFNYLKDKKLSENRVFEKTVSAINKEEKIIDVFKQINEVWFENSQESLFLISSLIHKLFYDVYIDINTNSKNYYSYLKIKRVVEYVKQNYKSKIDINMALDITNYSRGYFSCKFKEYTNMTFSEYLNNYRIKKACNFLINSSMLIKDIAKEVGYASEYYFTRVFKKNIGIAPTEYREINKYRLQ